MRFSKTTLSVSAFVAIAIGSFGSAAGQLGPEKASPSRLIDQAAAVAVKNEAANSKRNSSLTALIGVQAGPSATRTVQAGACTVFNNQAEFEAFNAEHGKVLKGIEHFEETPPGTGIVGVDDPLCGGIPNGPFDNGIEQFNLCVQANILGGAPVVPSPQGASGLVFVEFGSGFGENSDLVLANFFANSFDIMFGDPVPPDQQDNHTGVGFDAVSLFGGLNVLIRVYDKNNVEMLSTSSPANPGGSNFWGVWCPDTIGRINIFDTGNGAEGADNIEMWADIEPECGDGMVNQPNEECDGGDDAACPGECQPDCTCPPLCDKCPADFNGDCMVNAADLAFLLGNWGPCE